MSYPADLVNVVTRPVTSLGHKGGRKVFRQGPTFFKLCPIVLNYVQRIFPRGDLTPLRPL